MQARPQYFAGIIVERGSEVDDEMGGAIARKRVAVDADAHAGREFSPHRGTIEGDGVIARLRDLACMSEARAIARLSRRPRLGRHGVAGNWHDKNVAEI